jgi:hypothetical protein
MLTEQQQQLRGVRRIRTIPLLNRGQVNARHLHGLTLQRRNRSRHSHHRCSSRGRRCRSRDCTIGKDRKGRKLGRRRLNNTVNGRIEIRHTNRMWHAMPRRIHRWHNRYLLPMRNMGHRGGSNRRRRDRSGGRLLGSPDDSGLEAPGVGAAAGGASCSIGAGPAGSWEGVPAGISASGKPKAAKFIAIDLTKQSRLEL